VGCPANAEDGPEMRMVPIGGLGVEIARCCIVIGRQLCTAASPPSARIREQRRQPLRGSADQQEIKRGSRALETQQGKVRITMIKRRLEELNKHADDEQQQMEPPMKGRSRSDRFKRPPNR
jgi:hypothetical protein